MSEIFVGFLTAVWLFLLIFFLTKLLDRRIQGSIDRYRKDQEIFHIEDADHGESQAELLEWLSDHGQVLELTGSQGGTHTRIYSRVHE
jgi:hypothetical protein